ncbi:uncharacterized protein LOC133805826 [Humulus lupulus]|uniref:uncharacterized protein LOC133805826 n=1 Tax=Humulus lupulus TaxID=3486 RepID=UPI002B40B54B|nr:uncharacterized protein LOC133805826 [Humulus lupulus]
MANSTSKPKTPPPVWVPAHKFFISTFEKEFILDNVDGAIRSDLKFDVLTRVGRVYSNLQGFDWDFRKGDNSTSTGDKGEEMIAMGGRGRAIRRQGARGWARRAGPDGGWGDLVSRLDGAGAGNFLSPFPLSVTQVLSDPQKRAIYDQYGEEGLKGQVPPPDATRGFPGGGATFFQIGDGPNVFRFNPRNANDIFAEFFGFLSPFGGMGGGGGGG